MWFNILRKLANFEISKHWQLFPANWLRPPPWIWSLVTKGKWRIILSGPHQYSVARSFKHFLKRLLVNLILISHCFLHLSLSPFQFQGFKAILKWLIHFEPSLFSIVHCALWPTPTIGSSILKAKAPAGYISHILCTPINWWKKFRRRWTFFSSSEYHFMSSPFPVTNLDRVWKKWKYFFDQLVPFCSWKEWLCYKIRQNGISGVWYCKALKCTQMGQLQEQVRNLMNWLTWSTSSGLYQNCH